jgi:hypothetical protein
MFKVNARLFLGCLMGQMVYAFRAKWDMSLRSTQMEGNTDSLTEVGHSFPRKTLMLGRFISFSFGKGDYLVWQQEPLPTKSLVAS